MSSDNENPDVTGLLKKWSGGDESALENLIPIVYHQLRLMARRYMNKEGSGHTFQTTVLINEAYLKLSSSEGKEWNGRSHFFGVASRVMRNILVDHARAKQSKKRGGDEVFVTLTERNIVEKGSSNDILALDEALDRLAELDSRKTRVVEMKFFAGLEVEEISEVLGVSTATVKRDWSFSRSWLRAELSTER